MILSATVLALLALGSADPPLPEGNAFVQGLVQNQRRREEALNRYTYDLEEHLEELDARGTVTSRRVRRYEVFHVKGRPVRKLVAEAGQPLSSGEREKEERRVHEDVDAILRGKAAAEEPGVRLSAVLERYDFKTVGRQELDGWPVLVLDFEARPGKRELEGDVVLRTLAGRLFVDEAESQVVRAEVRNTSGIKFALGIGASVSTLGLVLDFRKVEDGLWLPSRVEAEAEARVLMLRGFRGRSTAIFSRFRRFEADSQEVVRPPGP